MNTNQLKRFAQDARNKLIEQVGAKLQFVLTHDTAELRGKQEALKKLKEAQKSLGDEALIEKIAYTWFNRLVALRFMDINDYQPLGLQVISPAAAVGHVPALLEAAHSGHLPEDLGVNTAQINDILDGKTGAANPDNEVFRLLLVAACDQLHEIFPFLFEKINDYTELLLPDDLTSNRSIVNDVVEGMSAEDCAEVEIIGWLYQFYISEKKDKVFASKSKVKKEDIPAATQLFTPRWIVEYMVQNTVGRLWLQNRPQSKLRDFMPYYIESTSTDAEDYLQVSSPEELTLLDQACGSGHILVYGFELLSKIYEEEGYNPSEIPTLIIKNNLFGFEIDERAAQLAGMAILMKARAYHRRFFRKGDVPEPHILCYQDLKLSEGEIKNVFETLNQKPSDELIYDLGNMCQATNFGSLIVPNSSVSEIHQALEATQNLKTSGDAFIQYQADQLGASLRQLSKLAKKYHCVVDNPPYMGSGKMNGELSTFVQLRYPNSKADLMACFMEAGKSVLLKSGFLGMINQQSWMFNPTYLRFREELVESWNFTSLLHLGPHTFPEIGGEVVQNAAFIIKNGPSSGDTVFVRLIDFNTPEQKEQEFYKKSNVYHYNISKFNRVQGIPFAYWINEKALDIISNNNPLSSYGDPKPGLQTSNNDRFLREWYELEISKIGYGLDRDSALQSNFKWFPHNKGGKSPRKWYGNNTLVINFYNDGEELKYWLENNPKDPSTKHWSRNMRNYSYYFKEGITWSAMSSKAITARLNGPGFTFDTSGPTLFVDSNLLYFSALLNSNVFAYFVDFFSQTMNKGTGDFSRVPVIIQDEETVTKLARVAKDIAKENWDEGERSAGFKLNGLLKHPTISIEETFELYEHYWLKKANHLREIEEQINSIFVSNYKLEEDLDVHVKLNDLTILKDEANLSSGKISFNNYEILSQFISYAVGNMFGRFSLDKEGLVLANQGERLQDYLAKVGRSEHEVRFLPDDDNIIPVLDDEWFEDDIVGRFHAFLKTSFGGKNFRKNLEFVEECLGKNMRKYFTKDFYKDHIKRYKKRPIYWMFSSPKGHFNVLVYLHRYTPDTISTILNSYLREFIEKLYLQMKQLKQMEISGSASEQAKARKEMDKLDLMLDDCREYEEILFELASERIALDLDDGVLVNYNKMGKAVATVPGLNDKKAKDKVKKFDWIDTSLIR